MYYLYYPVLLFSLYLCAAIVQLYRTYSLYYLVLRVSLCAVYLYYSAALTQILRALASTTQFVPSTASCCPPPIKRLWWRSLSVQPPSTINPPAMPCPHRVHPTDKACQTWPSKPFSNRHAKQCEIVSSFSSDYLTLQAIFEPTHQALWVSPVITHRITWPSKIFWNRRAKRC